MGSTIPKRHGRTGFTQGSNPGKEQKIGKKDKLAVYLAPEKKAELERRYHEDGSRSMTAFIERALDFYLDYLSAQDAGLFLPAAIRSCIEGRLGTMEKRMASLMFKLTVELDMCMSILADCTELDEEYLRRKRAESAERAKRTNGQMRFEQIARHMEDD